MGEHGQRIDQVELFFLVREGRRYAVNAKLPETEVPLAPLDELRIVVTALQPGAGHAVQVAYDSPAAAPEIQDVRGLADLDPATAQHVEDALRCPSPVGQEFPDVCRSLDQEHQL